MHVRSAGTEVLDKENSQANQPCDGALRVLTKSTMSKAINTGSTMYILCWPQVWEAEEQE